LHSWLRAPLVAAALCLWTFHASAMDIKSLWNFADPAASEALFRARLAGERGDDALSLQTQIARSYSLRSRFDDAHALLDTIEPQLAHAGPEPRVRYLLERGRTWRSAKQPGRAKPLFEQAVDLASANRLDELAVDAMHMLALVEPASAAQMRWNQRALALAQSSNDPNARSWDASLANNIGMTLHGEGRYDEALASFEAALAARERTAKQADIRVARWMVAWTLRALKRHDEALVILRRLERELEAIRETDGYVFEEIAENLLAQGQAAAAKPYFARAHTALAADTSLDRPDAERLARLLSLSH
jgi:tetratricopeptide (TPR) repeat protein